MVVELTLAVNAFNDEVVSCNEFVTELTLALNVFKAVIEDACEVLVDKAVDADVLNELALTTKLLALSSKLFISLSEDVVYATKTLAVICNAVIDANDEVANVFNKLTLVEVPQLLESNSIAANLVSWFDADNFNELAEVNKLAVAICKELVTALTLCENEFIEPVVTRKLANLFSVIDDVYCNAEADKNKDDAEIA